MNTSEYTAQALRVIPAQTSTDPDEVTYEKIVEKLSSGDNLYNLSIMIQEIVDLGKLMSIFKRVFFYLENSDSYIEENLLNSNRECLRQKLQKDPAFIRLIHAGIGMFTETCEFLEVLNEVMYEDENLIDVAKVVSELGDINWYANGLAVHALTAVNGISHDISTGDIMRANIAKLNIRYPEKFSGEKATNRDTEAEHEALVKELFI